MKKYIRKFKRNASFIIIVKISLFLTGSVVAQSGPGGIGMADGSSPLKLWLDAGNGVYSDTLFENYSPDAGKAMLWKDLSGSDNHVFAVSDTNSPVLISENPYFNNQPALKFNKTGTDSKRNFLVSKSFSSTNDITIYCVYHALSKAGGTNVSPYMANDYDENMWYFGSGLVDGGSGGFENDICLALCDSSLTAGAGDSTTSTDYCVKIPTSVNQTYVAVLQKEAWNGLLKLGNNTYPDVTYQAGKQPINNAPKYFIGSNSNVTATDDSPFFDGYISTVIIYNKILSQAERIILENYLSAKFNLELTNFDLYTFDEQHSGDYDYELVGIGKAADGSFQLMAQGEGIFQISNSEDFKEGEFYFTGNDGKTLSPVITDLPEGIHNRLERKWIFSGPKNKSCKMDLVLDIKDLPQSMNSDICLLIDSDNDGSFKDEKLGEGIISTEDVTSQGKIIFRNATFKNGNTFTIAKNKSACKDNCETYFTPNDDGHLDVYYIAKKGNTMIYDISGNEIKSIDSPGYWDGSDNNGELASPGIYFLITDKVLKSTVTLIR